MSSYISRHIGFKLFKIAIFILLDLFFNITLNAFERLLAFTAHRVKNYKVDLVIIYYIPSSDSPPPFPSLPSELVLCKAEFTSPQGVSDFVRIGVKTAPGL